MPRSLVIGLALVAAITGLGCSRVVTGPSFKSQVPQGGTFFGEVYSPMSVTNTGVLKVSTGEGQGYFLVTALDGQLFTYDLKTGKRLDKKPLARLPKGVRSAPYNDTTNKHLILGCYDKMVHALDINTGAVHWRAPVGGYVQASPVLSDGVVVIGTTNGKVYGIAPIDGSMKWQVDVDGAVYSAAGVNPAWPNRALIGTAEGTGVMIDTVAGKSIGEFKAGSPLHAAPAIVSLNNEAVAFCPTMDGGLIAYNLPASGMPGTGSERWTGVIGTTPSWATPAVAPIGTTEPTGFNDAVVYAVDDGSDLVALNAGDGKELWRLQIEPLDRLHSTPLVAGDRIYVPSINHKLFAIERATGKAIWDFTCFGELRGTPLLDDNRLVFVSNDHFLYALDWETGKPIMQSLTPSPSPAVLDLTRGPVQAEAVPIDESVIRAEINPVMEQVLASINASNESTLAGYMHDADPMRQSTWASAVVAAYAGLQLGQHNIATLDIASPGDIVAVLTISATRDGKPVQIFLTPHLVKDVSKTPAWQIDPESLKPGTIREMPVMENPQ